MADEENASQPKILRHDISVPETVSANLLIVVPQQLSVVVDSVEEKDPIGSLHFEYRPNAGDEASESPASLNEAEYDEDEQLYAAMKQEQTKRVQLTVYACGPEKSVLVVVAPHVEDVLAQKSLADTLGQLAQKCGRCIVLAPCSLGWGQLICRLDLPGDFFATVDPIRPPHYVSGLAAALVSELTQNSKADLGLLALNAEGHVGYEKVDADSIMAAAENFASYLVGKSLKASYIERLSRNVRRIASSVTSGMYL